MKLDRSSMLLYAVTDRSWLGTRSLYECVECALRGGVTCVQLREKELAEDAFLDEAKAINALCKSYGVPFFINDNVDVALKCGADGVHIGQCDAAARDVRARAGGRLLLGVSAQNAAQAVAAQKDGADYIGVGAIFPTQTKTDADDVSISVLREICAAVSIPVVAIGGINKRNITLLHGSGADGVALVSAIFAADDIERECRLLRKLSSEMTQKEDSHD
ncbi:MAG: thiamine phosphate synthase [Clostridia bacterium]|nr:thiamine phosphate synthase [Clostridia bacterium]